ncbi:glucocorticoid induced 1a isoform X3 [Pleuronectes platessa]|nr:glucocorticoid induced 1a isoform X3 [Pleuronectes platessa]
MLSEVMGFLPILLMIAKLRQHLQHGKQVGRHTKDKDRLSPLQYNTITYTTLTSSTNHNSRASPISTFPCRSRPRCRCPTSQCQSLPSRGCPAAWRASTMSWRRSSSKTTERRRSSSPWRFLTGGEHPSLLSSAAAAPEAWTPRLPQPPAGPAAAQAYRPAPRQLAHQDHMTAAPTPQRIYWTIGTKTVEAAHHCPNLPPHPNPTTVTCSSESRRRAVRRSKLLRR